MANAPARACGRAGCRGIIREDVCSVCGPRKRGGWQDDAQRGTRHQRGYDAAWVALRRQFILEKTLEAAESGKSLFPICELCGKTVEKTPEIHVDHVKAFSGLDDPLRLNRGNLRPSRITGATCAARPLRGAIGGSVGAGLPSYRGGGGSDSQPLPQGPRSALNVFLA